MKENRFIITATIILILALISAFALIGLTNPNIITATAFILTIGFVVNLFYAILFYSLAHKLGFETDREIFRRGYRKGIYIGILAVILLTVQLFFDII